MEVERPPEKPLDGRREVLTAIPLRLTGELARLQSDTSESGVTLGELALFFNWVGVFSFEVLPLFLRRVLLPLFLSRLELSLFLTRLELSLFRIRLELPLFLRRLELPLLC